MKKLLLIILVLAGLALVSSYFIIPSQVIFGKVIYIKANRNSAGRYLYDEQKWSKWWPADSTNILSRNESEAIYFHKKYAYTISRKMHEGINISIEHDANIINSFLHVISLNKDSVVIEWKGELPVTQNPLRKIKNYFLATAFKNNISEVLQNAQTFLENKESVYGLNIIQEKVKDTILIAVKSVSTLYPDTSRIYNLIESVKNYIVANGAVETNFPMLNVTQDSGFYRTMVAIPVNKIIPENAIYLVKKMVPGKILVTEVKGGRYCTVQAIKQIETYMDDYRLQSPAIHFESLVTNRMEEHDTSKWVTKIYYPLF